MADISPVYEDLIDGLGSGHFPDGELKTFEDFHRKCAKLQKEQDMLVVTLSQMADENKRLIKERERFLIERSNIIEEREMISKNFKLLETACCREIKKLKKRIDFLTNKAYPNQALISDSAEDTEEKSNSNSLETVEIADELHYSSLLKVINTISPNDDSGSEIVSVKKKSSNQVFDCRPFNGPKTPPTPGGTENKSHNRSRSCKELYMKPTCNDDDSEHVSESNNSHRSRQIIRESENQRNFSGNLPLHSEAAPASEMMEYLDRHKDKFQMFRSWFSKYNDEKHRQLDAKSSKDEEQKCYPQSTDNYKKSSYQEHQSTRLKEEYPTSKYRFFSDRVRFDGRTDYNTNYWKGSQSIPDKSYYGEYVDRNGGYQHNSWHQGSNKWYSQNRNYHVNTYNSRTKYEEDSATYNHNNEALEKGYRQETDSRDPDQEDLDFYKELWNRHKRELAKLGSTESAEVPESFQDLNVSDSYHQYPKRNRYHQHESQHMRSRDISGYYPHCSTSANYSNRSNYRDSEYYQSATRKTSTCLSEIDKDHQGYTKQHHYQYDSNPVLNNDYIKESSFYYNRQHERENSREYRTAPPIISHDNVEGEGLTKKKNLTSVVVLPKKNLTASYDRSDISAASRSSSPADIIDQETLPVNREARMGRTRKSGNRDFEEEILSVHGEKTLESQECVREPRKKKLRRNESLDSYGRRNILSLETKEQPVSSPISSKTYQSIDDDIDQGKKEKVKGKKRNKNEGSSTSRLSGYEIRHHDPTVNVEKVNSRDIIRLSENEKQYHDDVENEEANDDRSIIKLTEHRSRYHNHLENSNPCDDFDIVRSTRRRVRHHDQEEDEYEENNRNVEKISENSKRFQDQEKNEDTLVDTDVIKSTKHRLRPKEDEYPLEECNAKSHEHQNQFQDKISSESQHDDNTVVKVSGHRTRRQIEVENSDSESYRSVKSSVHRKQYQDQGGKLDDCNIKPITFNFQYNDKEYNENKNDGQVLKSDVHRAHISDKVEFKNQDDRNRVKFCENRKRRFEPTDCENNARSTMKINEQNLRHYGKGKFENVKKCNALKSSRNKDKRDKLNSPATSRSDSFSPRVFQKKDSQKSTHEKSQVLDELVSDHSGVDEESGEEYVEPEIEDPKISIEREIDWNIDSTNSSPRKNKTFRDFVETDPDLVEEGEISDSAGEEANTDVKKIIFSSYGLKKIGISESGTLRCTENKQMERPQVRNETRERSALRPHTNNYARGTSSIRARLGRRFVPSNCVSAARHSNYFGARFTGVPQRSFLLNKRGRLSGYGMTMPMRKRGSFDNVFRQDHRLLAYKHRRLQ